MTTPIEEFGQVLLNSVRTAANVEQTFTGDAFMNEMSRRLTDAEEVDSLTQGHFEGLGIKNKKIAFDGYDFGDQDGHVVLAISQFYNESDIQTLTDTEAQRLFGLVTGFVEAVLGGTLDDSLEQSSVGYQVAHQLREQLPRTFKIRVYLLTNGILSTRVKSFESRDLGSLTLEFYPWDLQRTQQVEESSQGREEIDIDLTDWDSLGVPCLKAAISDTSVQTYLAVVPGAALAGIYLKYGARVLESNVRSFLSARVNVNRGIRGTLLQQPEMFLSYNNGITATATDVVVKRIDGELRLLEIRDLQIVNGGQTTASIFYAQKEEKGVDLSEVFVQMKLIVVSEAEQAEIVPKISRYANTQNRISDADFFSNHRFHQRMEEKSRRILAPAIAGAPYRAKWFYERTRGQYNTEKSRLGTAGARQFEVEYPRGHVITKTDAAKYIVSWSALPHLVSSGAQKNFIQFAKEIDEQWTRNEDQFGDGYFKWLVAKGLLFNGLRTRIMTSPWYKESPGYLANIVTYTVAKLVDIVARNHKGYQFDLNQIWEDQGLPDSLWEQLQPIAIEVRRALTSDDRQVPNVTEWAKREKCWDVVKAIDIEEDPGFASFLVSTSARAEATKADAVDQRLLSGIEAQVHVLSRGSAHWAALRAFGLTIRALSPRDDSILSVAGSSSARPLSEAQAQVVVAIENRLIASGYKVD